MTLRKLFKHFFAYSLSLSLRKIASFILQKYNGNKMPTATDVDNRPVAIGKWPRLRRNGHAYPIALRRTQTLTQNSNHSTTTHKDWCTLENCVHSCDESSNICTDVLLQPELLQELYGDRSKYLISFHKLLK